MKIVIDIPADDFNAIRQGGLYFIGHDKLDQCITEAFQSCTIIPKGHGDLIDREVYRKEFLDSRTFEPMKILDMQQTLIPADKGV